MRGLVLTSNTIEEILELRAGDLVLILDPICSLIVIDGDDVRVLHKSLDDFLLDVTRGGHLPFDLNQLHGLLSRKIYLEEMDCAEEVRYVPFLFIYNLV